MNSVSSLRLLGPMPTITQVDMGALRNLIDPAEEEFLRGALPPAEFSKIMEERTQAIIAYLEEGKKGIGLANNEQTLE